MLRMILAIFGVAAVVVGMLGFRGQITTNRPRHVFWDMKYQPKYTPQGQSRFFADGRTMRTPLVNTVPYSGMNYSSDAGYLPGPDADFLKADDVYYRGVQGPDKEVEEVTDVPVLGKDGKPEKGADGKPKTEKKTEKKKVPDWVRRIPASALGQFDNDWNKLLKRGQERYNINCAVCHGATGFGGQGDSAHGIVGRYGMVGIANYHDDRIRQMDDGEIFNTITNGKNTMSSYGHQVKVADRWAIVAYLRALQLSQKVDETRVSIPNDVQGAK